MTAQGEAPPNVVGWILYSIFLAKILIALAHHFFRSTKLREISSFMISLVPP
jgi:hypothetical protein